MSDALRIVKSDAGKNKLLIKIRELQDYNILTDKIIEDAITQKYTEDELVVYGSDTSLQIKDKLKPEINEYLDEKVKDVRLRAENRKKWNESFPSALDDILYAYSGNTFKNVQGKDYDFSSASDAQKYFEDTKKEIRKTFEDNLNNLELKDEILSAYESIEDLFKKHADNIKIIFTRDEASAKQFFYLWKIMLNLNLMFWDRTKGEYDASKNPDAYNNFKEKFEEFVKQNETMVTAQLINMRSMVQQPIKKKQASKVSTAPPKGSTIRITNPASGKIEDLLDNNGQSVKYEDYNHSGDHTTISALPNRIFYKPANAASPKEFRFYHNKTIMIETDIQNAESKIEENKKNFVAQAYIRDLNISLHKKIFRDKDSVQPSDVVGLKRLYLMYKKLRDNGVKLQDALQAARTKIILDVKPSKSREFVKLNQQVEFAEMTAEDRMLPQLSNNLLKIIEDTEKSQNVANITNLIDKLYSNKSEYKKRELYYNYVFNTLKSLYQTDAMIKNKFSKELVQLDWEIGTNLTV